MARVPRFMLAAASSGSGKTTIVCGLLRLLGKRGLTCGAFKVGPDYLDPTFHRRMTGASTGNLDLFFCDEDHVRSLLVGGAQGCDVSILEGVMGYYDGILGQGTRASSYDVARATATPAVLVINARGASLSLAAQIAGFANFRRDSQVRGFILNRCSKGLYQMLAPQIERECDLRGYGYVPADPAYTLESRHLGLVDANEVTDLDARLEKISSCLTESLDVEGLLTLAYDADALDATPLHVEPVTELRPRIAVAHDRAFSFYYTENLRLLEQLGAELVEFSPLADRALPKATCGLYLGGGYPEVHAAELSANSGMLCCVRKAVKSGLPCVAECGGFMYLQSSIEDESGHAFPMAGVLPGSAANEGKLRHFGYVELCSQSDGLLASAYHELRAHEFHYWHSQDEGEAFDVTKPGRRASWKAAFHTPTLYAGYPHLYWPGDATPAERFIRAAAAWAAKVGEAE
ncbi:cobyrinate a,c-diamide synthase [Paratractidigestivibacter sp.]|uniref:cobyrinate a,c-diamide synthase n=1 Tax=Paratractidigestivibacter sp. TaxID=2847316 RepID=UPI002AC9920F|nr:cobyrinate a,c-diamide synthase [Paratractidigestivibacter sp.]